MRVRFHFASVSSNRRFAAFFAHRIESVPLSRHLVFGPVGLVLAAYRQSDESGSVSPKVGHLAQVGCRTGSQGSRGPVLLGLSLCLPIPAHGIGIPSWSRAQCAFPGLLRICMDAFRDTFHAGHKPENLTNPPLPVHYAARRTVPAQQAGLSPRDDRSWLRILSCWRRPDDLPRLPLSTLTQPP